MSLRRLVVLAAGLLVAASAAPAEAGHRSCRTCSTGQGNWFHFTSGSGYYVPYARKTET